MHRSASIRILGLIVLVVILMSMVAGLLLNTTTAQAAVIFTQFIAVPGDTQVSVQWSTSSEINTNGFYVLSSLVETGTYSRVSAFYPRQGTSIYGASYAFIHTGLTNGIPVYYKLEIITNDLTSFFTGSISTIPNSPTPTSTMTLTFTPTYTFTPTLTLTPTTTSTLTVSPTTSITSTTTITATLTRTLTITPTRTYTRVPTSTRRPATAVPTRTLVRIMTSTPLKTVITSGGGYPGENTVGTPTEDGTATTPDTTSSGSGYPDDATVVVDTNTTPELDTVTPKGSFVTQGTPVPFRSPTPTTESISSSSSGAGGWIIGIVAGLSLLGGGTWYYFRLRTSGAQSGDDLFTDDPEN